MRDLNYELKQLCRRNRDGAYATQVARERALTLIAEQLEQLGYCKMTLHSIKPKHVIALVEKWQNEGRSDGTIKNRMAHLRWWAEKINKSSVIHRDNCDYGISDRLYVTNRSKARQLLTDELEKVTDPNTALSLRLQAAFGLRREESIKFRPAFSDRGTMLVLKASWCKGGRSREIPILTSSQRAVLDDAHMFCGDGSLIPQGMSYVDQLERFKYQCGKAGIHNVHGHRHDYAQWRYFSIAGWACPAQDGPTCRDLTSEQKAVDRAARMQISSELGHEREQITATYLGR